MSGLTIPTDSVLRRHFEQLAASRGLPPPPEDSTLRRHYLQALESGFSPVDSGPGAGSGTAAAPSPAEAPAAAAPEKAPQPQGRPEPQGWFARLMAKLFGS